MSLVRLGVAGLLLFFTAYVFSWPVLWSGMQGSDLLWHLHLATWADGAFPGLPWWDRWDGGGIPYREAYPLIPHWIALALAHAFGLRVEQGIQLVEFLVSPLGALGLYAFLAWRRRRPLAGLVAGFLFLLSPIAWVGLFDFGLYANQVGTVFFMPCLIALDVLFEAWQRGDRSWRLRLAAGIFIGLAALMGSVSHQLFPAPLIAALLYGLAASRGQGWRWLGLAVALGAAGVLLQLFWILPNLEFLAATGARTPRLVFSVGSLTRYPLDVLLQLRPIDPFVVDARWSVSPAVSLLAVAGAACALWSRTARPLLALAGFGLLFMTQSWLYAAIAVFPFGQLFTPVVKRPSEVFVEFGLPLLAGVGLFELPAAAAAWLAGRARRPALRLPLASAAALAALTVLAVDVAGFAFWVQGVPYRLAYGTYGGTTRADVRDLWGSHREDYCPFVSGLEAVCQDPVLDRSFSVSDLRDACRQRDGIPICAALSRWSRDDDHLVGETLSWCALKAGDPVCSARYTPVAEQLVPSRWRPLRLGCLTDQCARRQQELADLRGLFPMPPLRAELNSDAGDLEKAFHELTGGAQAETYASLLPTSIGLESFLEDSMLARRGTQVKAGLAEAAGVDAVVLAPGQLAQASDYEALGWLRFHDRPRVYLNPDPSPLALAWPGGNAVLVVGASQANAADVYNALFKDAAGGLVPFQSGWLVRGRSAYVDDYSPAELSEYRTVVLLGYRYHERGAAWSRLDDYVRQGGGLYVETGWQYVDPDWNLGGGAPPVLPVGELRWAQLDAAAAVSLDGSVVSDWGSFSYPGSSWGASSSGSVRPGAGSVVRVGSRVVSARWARGSGKVVWSGMNLIAHADSRGSAAESEFLRSSFSWLLGTGGGQVALAPEWVGTEVARLPLGGSGGWQGPVWVLFKESNMPGWSATLETPGQSRPVAIVPSEMDYMLVRLDSVPPGSRLVFRYGPTVSEIGAWAVSLLATSLLVLWMLRPAVYRPLLGRALRIRSRLRSWWIGLEEE